MYHASVSSPGCSYAITVRSTGGSHLREKRLAVVGPCREVIWSEDFPDQRKNAQRGAFWVASWRTTRLAVEFEQASISFTEAGLLIVDAYNHRIQKYDVGKNVKD